MTGRMRRLKWIVLASLCSATVIAFFVIRHTLRPITIVGAVTIQDADAKQELPIADVEISAASGAGRSSVRSDVSGLFALTLTKWVRKGQPIVLTFRHDGYEPLDLKEVVDSRLYVVRLAPLVKKTQNVPTVTIGNVRVRYSIKATRTLDVGSAVKVFEVENKGNIPCKGRHPCSPDGKWKAALDSTSLDAGPGNQFRDVRVSCIAGPCPFTRIESTDFSQPSQTITARARAWSDTATFLVEAEVVHVMQSDIDHQSYPVIFGPGLNFALPADAEGISVQADVSGETVIFPLGPDLFLSWATCETRPDQDKSTIYRCVLKPGYVFR